MRWIYGFSLLLFSMSQALAATVNSDADSFNGFYGGISGGASLTSGQSSTVATGTFDFLPQAFLVKTEVNSQNQPQTTDPKGSIFMGFGHTWQVFYLSAELFTSLSRYNMQTSAYSGILQPGIVDETTSEKTSIKLNPAEYGIDLRPGVLLTSGTLLYGRIGVARNKLMLHTTNDTVETIAPFGGLPTEVLAAQDTISSDKMRTAPRLGVGIEQHLSQQLTLRADYIHTNYGKIAVSDSGVPVSENSAQLGPGVISTNTDSSANLSNNSIMLGLTYYISPATSEDKVSALFDFDEAANFNGFYSGVGIGGTFSHAQNDINTNNSTTFVNSDVLSVPIVTQGDISANKLNGGFYSGYGRVWHALYLGAEGFLNISPLNMSSSASGGISSFGSPTVPQEIFDANTKVKLSNQPVEYGLDLRPGVLLTPSSLLYGRVGVAFNQTSIKATTAGNVDFLSPTFPNPEHFSASMTGDKQQNVAALRLGGGIEQRFGQHFSVRADYTHTRYPTITMTQQQLMDVDSVNFGPLALSADSKNSDYIVTNAVMLEFSYYL